MLFHFLLTFYFITKSFISIANESLFYKHNFLDHLEIMWALSFIYLFFATNYAKNLNFIWKIFTPVPLHIYYPFFFSCFWGCWWELITSKENQLTYPPSVRYCLLSRGAEHEATENRDVLGLGRLSLGLSFPFCKMREVLKFNYKYFGI